MLSLITACCVLHAAETLPFMEKIPSIRGIPGDPAWRSALMTSDFKQNSRGESNGKITEWIGRTADSLYAALLSEHANTDAFHHDQTAHDGEIYKDDDFEIFLDFRGRKKDYLLIIGNTNGAVLDLYVDRNRRQRPDYESGAVVRGSVLKKGYYIEMAIPLASLRLGENETGSIGLCLARSIAWNKDSQSCFGKFHQPNTWKYFQLPFKTPLILKSVSCKLIEGRQPFRFELFNTSTRKLALNLDFSGAQCPVTIPPRTAQVFRLETALKAESEPIHKTLKISDRSGRTLLQWGAFGKVRPVFEAALQSFVLYDGENARIKIILNDQASGTVNIRSVSQDGKILARKTLAADGGEKDVEVAVPAGTACILCEYGSAQKTFPVRIIPSPWGK